MGGYSGEVMVLRLSANGDTITNAYPLTAQKDLISEISEILFSDDGRRMVTTASAGTACVWSMEDPAIPTDFEKLLDLARKTLPVTLTREEQRQLSQ